MIKKIVIDDIPVELDLDAVLKKVRVDDGTPHADRVGELVEAAGHIARPKAIVGLAYIEKRNDDSLEIDGIEFRSRVLTVNLADTHRVFPYAATCGVELADWAADVDGLLERYWANAILEAALRKAAKAANERIEHEFQPGPTSSMNPGSLEDWPIEQQKVLFALLGDPQSSIGVNLTDSCLMIPVKSVSGIRFPTETSFENCQLCPRPDCPGRRAPYDEKLWRRYAKS